MEYLGNEGLSLLLTLIKNKFNDIVPLSKGGTGASDPSTARENLEIETANVEDAVSLWERVTAEGIVEADNMEFYTEEEVQSLWNSIAEDGSTTTL